MTPASAKLAMHVALGVLSATGAAALAFGQAVPEAATVCHGIVAACGALGTLAGYLTPALVGPFAAPPPPVPPMPAAPGAPVEH